VARAIGVSNFLVPHLEELLGRARRKPDVNQIELSPFLQRRDTTALCAREGIVVEAYSPLTRGARFGHPVVVEIARRLGKSPAQVLLRWAVQHGFVVLPKSTREERIRENAALFDWVLGAGDVAKLDGLEEGLTTGWDPAAAASRSISVSRPISSAVAMPCLTMWGASVRTTLVSIAGPRGSVGPK
jgi:diketogulonate reductase-like aldo/keto reductase